MSRAKTSQARANASAGKASRDARAALDRSDMALFCAMRIKESVDRASRTAAEAGREAANAMDWAAQLEESGANVEWRVAELERRVDGNVHRVNRRDLVAFSTVVSGLVVALLASEFLGLGDAWGLAIGMTLAAVGIGVAYCME